METARKRLEDLVADLAQQVVEVFAELSSGSVDPESREEMETALAQKQQLLEKMQKQLKNFGGSEDQKRSEAKNLEREVTSRSGAGTTVKFPKELPKYKREANLDLFFEETEAVLGSVRIDQRY